MKYYVVSLLALFLLSLQTSHALAHGFARGAGSRHFVSRPVVIINPGHARFVHVSPFANRVIIFPHNQFLIREPFFCFHHGIGFFDEPLFFDHLHRFHGIAFEAIPGVVVHSGSQVFFFEN